MSNIATIVGDPHLKNSNIGIMTQLVDKVEKLGNPVIWLGDMLDTKEVIRGKCLNFWYNYFSKSPLQHTILVGNHDWFNLQCQDHSLRTLSDLENVLVVEDLEEIAENTYAIPYIHDDAHLKKILKKIPKDSILFGHLEIKEFDYGNGRMCETGLTTKSFSKFKKVISGHFHKFQQKGNLTYLGTPFSHSFGEANQDKFIGIIDLETGELELEYTELPMHLSIRIDCSEGDLANQHFMFMDDLEEQKNHWRLVLEGTQEEILKFPKDKYKHKSLKFIERPTDDGLINVDIEDTATNEEQFTKWATEIKQLDPKTIELGLNIMEAVK